MGGDATLCEDQWQLQIGDKQLGKRGRHQAGGPSQAVLSAGVWCGLGEGWPLSNGHRSGKVHRHVALDLPQQPNPNPCHVQAVARATHPYRLTDERDLLQIKAFLAREGPTWRGSWRITSADQHTTMTLYRVQLRLPLPIPLHLFRHFDTL